jgi:hypothetical protein
MFLPHGDDLEEGHSHIGRMRSPSVADKDLSSETIYRFICYHVLGFGMPTFYVNEYMVTVQSCVRSYKRRQG